MTESLAEAFLEQSPECHWIAGEDRVFHRAYGGTSSVFGRPAAELRGRPLEEVLDPAAAALWRSRLDRILAGETLRLRERRGDAAWYITMFPFRAGGARFAGGLARELTPLATAEKELRFAVLSALKAQEFERDMVSKFLHDMVGQNLTAFGLQLDLLRMDLERSAPEACSHIGELQKLLGTVMEQVRDYSYELNPSAVERAGLRSAVDRLAARLRGRFTGVMRINVDPSLKFDPRIATAMFQILQEAVENAVQHAGCSTIDIAVKSTKNGPLLEVSDNGRGFDPGDLSAGCRGLGLLSMEHHAAQAGLSLSITGNPGSGCAVRAVADRNL
ncbi:MAG TPA: ATP-binding protein [Bryobacteraceae bacterium]|nr:ATP-binding protein [Bryobacteraceae bacterium]